VVSIDSKSIDWNALEGAMADRSNGRNGGNPARQYVSPAEARAIA
jgi:hypothetical protein